jgi:DNA-directed RNA polymerase subunit M/transcription elongation factor TFIIS
MTAEIIDLPRSLFRCDECGCSYFELILAEGTTSCVAFSECAECGATWSWEGEEIEFRGEP